KYLPKCLEALNHQTFSKENYEVIVSDNNSTDKTQEIAKQFGARVVQAQKQGNTFALEKGWASAKGDIIAGTDADTVPDSRWLEEISNTFSDEKIVGLTGKATTDFDSLFLKIFTSVLYDLFLRISFACGVPNLSGFNIAFRTEAYNKVGGINVTLTMSTDVDLGKRLKKIGKVVYSPNVKATTSARRWKDGFWKTLWEYIDGYISVNFLHKPPVTKQKVIR
ncbi:MAG TPA: glycosyltransferase, partial [Candidatus Levybacteria bacterium]|nr:glycosyltransferase [Candidatus Levybacteria bacterium]